MALVVPEGIYPTQLQGAELVFAELNKYLDQPNNAAEEPYAVRIVGGAGAGKSWTTTNSLIPTVLETLKESKKAWIDCVVTTTTHQANGVIADELSDAGITSVSVSTIHSFLGITPWSGTCVRNPPKFTDCGYKLNDTPNVLPIVIFVDEAFRIDPHLWAIMQCMRPNALWICTYDAYQTPPVGYSSSPIEELNAPKAVLTESPRFINSGELAKLVTDLRKTVSKGMSNYRDIFDSYLDKAYTIAPVKEFGDIVKANLEILPKDVLMVCGTRKASAQYNTAIHKLRKRKGLDIFQQGDPIIVEYVVGDQENKDVNIIRRERMFDMDMSQAENVPECLKKYPYVYRLGKRDIYLIPIFTPTSEAPYKLWKECKRDNIIIVGIRLNYARTVHTAQGMTVPNVYINVPSIYNWSNHDMRRRLLYTGASRCSGTLKVINE